MSDTITQWSYSRHQTWALCPKKAYFQYVMRYPTGPKSEPMQRGIDAHEVCAAIYEGKWPEVAGPPTLEWRHVLAKQKSFYGPDLEAELNLAWDRDWARSAWFDKRTVYRCAFDGMAYTPDQGRVLQIFEHKTGRKRTDHDDQADWYAGAGTLVVPDADTTRVDIHYLDLPAGTPAAVLQKTYSRREAGTALIAWKEKAKEMMADTEFPTRAGYHCRWCPFAKSAGGPCHLG